MFKKILAILMVCIMLLSLVACGTINENPVAVLWSNDTDTYLSSLSNAIDRAMYIENITYEHYNAKNDQAAQTEQAQKAIDANCAVLLVNLVDSSAAQSIVDMAKAKDIPLVFFACDVDDEVLASYDKCAFVDTDASTLDAKQGELIGTYIAELVESDKLASIDRNGDGKISYVAFDKDGADAVVEAINKTMVDYDKALQEESKGKKKLAAIPTLEFYDAANEAKYVDSATAKDAMNNILATYNDDNKNMVELIIANDDVVALEVLAVLQENGFNSNKLKTHLIPLFGVGANVDAKAFKDTSNMKPEEVEELIFTTTDVIGAGQMAGSAMEDYDANAAAIAKISANYISGADMFAEIDETQVKGNKVLVPYSYEK